MSRDFITLRVLDNFKLRCLIHKTFFELYIPNPITKLYFLHSKRNYTKERAVLKP